MNTILTDDELPPMPDGTHPQSLLGQMLLKYADAREAAVLAKLAQQEPVAWRYQDAKGNFRYRGYKVGFDTEYSILKPVALYANPAPQQADRQRVPDEPDWRHPRIQALIGADARNRICIDLVWRILEDPNREFTAGDMEYWDKLHDKVQEVALAAAPELLEALELLTAGIESSVSDTYIPLVKARAAIAKATGEKA